MFCILNQCSTFSQNTNSNLISVQVDVDVYRSLGPKRAGPLEGSCCFFQEKLTAWRELNAAHDWLEAAQELHSLCQTLPQLLHHQNDILDIILCRVTMPAALSLEPLMELIGALARDLQADFLPHMERVLRVLSDLVDEGADHEPEMLQHVFTCCSLICKHLSKLVAANLSPVLAQSARLRYHRAQHVRIFAAQTFGFLLRHATAQEARAAVRSVLADAVVRPSVARITGAGLLVAEGAIGVGNGLHSRGPVLLSLLLQDDILNETDFGVAAGKEDKNTVVVGGGGNNALSGEMISARVAAVAAECIDRLLNHVRRGPGVTPLWETMFVNVTTRIDALTASRSRSAQRGDDALQWAAARGVALLARMIEYRRGSRVETFDPHFAIAKRLASAEVVPGHDNGKGASKVGKPPQNAEKTNKEEEEEKEQENPFSEFLKPSLSGQVLRYLESLVYSHCKTVSASEGPVAIERAAPFWVGVFGRAPRREILFFVRALITPPAGPDVSRCFAPHMFAAVGNSLLAGEDAELCWPLLMDLCSQFGVGSSSSASIFGNTTTTTTTTTTNVVVPVVLTAVDGIGSKLSKLICSTVASLKPSASAEQVQIAWAALHCLPHAVATPSQAAQYVAKLLDSSTKILEKAAAAQLDKKDDENAEEKKKKKKEFEVALMLHCAARAAAVAARSTSHDTTTESTKEKSETALKLEALELVHAHPQAYHAVHAAGEALSQLSRSNPTSLSTSSLLQLAPLLAPNLSHPSVTLRVATLRVLCSFQQPPYLVSSDAQDDSAAITSTTTAAHQQQPCDALQQLLSVNARELGADGGRPAIVALGRVKTNLEFHRIPLALVPLVVRALLGVLHIRFAPLWPAVNVALAAALDAYPLLTWPLLLEELNASQTAFLGGDCYAQPRSSDSSSTTHSTSTTTALVVEEAPVELGARFLRAVIQGSGAAAGGSTDAAARLTHILRALATANTNTVEGKSKEWVPLFLFFSAAKSPDGVASNVAEDDDGDDDENDENDDENEESPSEVVVSITPRVWRVALREWLGMLAGLKGIRGTHRAAALQHAVASHCLDIDPLVQKTALKCLKAFKLPWLLPYLEKLMRLADNATLRSELAAFPLGLKSTSVRGGDDMEAILPEHRANLVPLLVALLFPKMRKRSGRLGGKGKNLLFFLLAFQVSYFIF